MVNNLGLRTMKSVTDTNGVEYHVYGVLRGTQIYPGFVQVNLQQTTSKVRGPGIGKTIPEWMADLWLAGTIRVTVS